MSKIDTTHDPNLRSFVESANAGSDFPIQNLPLGVFQIDGQARVGIAIGELILDVAGAFREGLFDGAPKDAAAACTGSSLNPLMSLGRAASSALRGRASALLRHDSPERARVEPHLVRMSDVDLLLPAHVHDYTDFYASVHHATNVGSMFRPDNPLLPNYKWIPVGYHGRASSIVVSGTPVRRPRGQTRNDQSKPPRFGPSSRLDYEMEIGCFVGRPNPLGHPVSIDKAEDHVFGLCILNDWSARDIQAWEYQPLGPFLAKNFATSISPWVVTTDALAPFRAPRAVRPDDDPHPMPHLDGDDDRLSGGFDVIVSVELRTVSMHERGMNPVEISRGNLRDMYWTFAQMLTHHTSGGCNLQAGDLLGSGTVSGPEKSSRGCLLELTWKGTDPVSLPTGETRMFLQDGDEVVMKAWCEKEGFARIGFGECSGEIMKAS
jgi:fumarylacetoacetase